MGGIHSGATALTPIATLHLYNGSVFLHIEYLERRPPVCIGMGKIFPLTHFCGELSEEFLLNYT